METEKHFEPSENTTYQNLGNAAKAVFTGIFIELDAYIQNINKYSK